jgi:hypothetical protein
MAVDITALYCCLDDFCKVFGDWEAHRLIPSPAIRQRAGKLSRSEMLFIVVLYWLRVFRLIGLACKVLGLLILVLSPEPIYGPLFLGGQNDEK